MRINNLKTSVMGTSLVGFMHATFAQLVERLGPPMMSDSGKVDAMWRIQDGHITATIYNYKDGANYLGAQGTPVEEIVSWNIGGFDTRAVDFIHALFPHNEIERWGVKR